MSYICRLFAATTLLLHSFLTASATSFVPVRRHNSRNGSLRNRDLATHMKSLHPRSNVDLLYLPDDGSNSILITVTAIHHRESYIVVEDIDPLIYNILCSEDSGTLSLDFRQDAGYKSAKQLWSRHESLLFVTHHLSCNSDSERAVHRTSDMTFDDTLLRMTASSQSLPLGESAHASSEITISGIDISRTDLRRLSRRDEGPEVTKSTAFDLNAAFTAGKDHLLTIAGLELYCDDCSISGQVSPFFKYRINTEIMDCVDKLTAPKRRDDILAGIEQDFGTGLDCIGDGLKALIEGLGDDVVDLIKGKPDKELPVLSWIVPEAIVGIEASEEIHANLNFEASAATGIDVKCSFPGGIGANCEVSALSPLLAPKTSTPPSFKLGSSWELALSFAYGLTVEAKAVADIDIKMPITAEVGQGQSAQLSIISPSWQNTIDPKITVGEPAFSATNPEVCLSLAFGPSITASLGSTKIPRLSNLRASARLDLPRVQSCFKPAHDVGTDCQVGAIKNAVELDVTAGFGLDVELSSVFTQSENLTPSLYRSLDPYKHCFSSGGSAKSTWGGWNQTGSPSLNGTPPATPTGDGSPNPTSFSSPGGVQGNHTSTYDCTGVDPSPGGQPCAYMGGGPVACLSLYSWSCPNGDSGPVPAGTICACGAFRHPGWQPRRAAVPACSSGIYCYDEETFGVCGPAGIEPPQPVAPGTVCIGGAIAFSS